MPAARKSHSTPTATKVGAGKPTDKVMAALADVKVYDHVPDKLLAFNMYRSHGLLWRLSERYNLETGLYMFEPWERCILNTILVIFIFFVTISNVSMVQWLLGAPQLNSIIWSAVVGSVFGEPAATPPPVEY